VSRAILVRRAGHHSFGLALATMVVALLPLVTGTIVWRWSSGPAWDEAVYIARATLTEHWRDLWGSSRMFGVSLIVAPVLAVTDTLGATRIWFAAVTSALAVTAVRWWALVAGWRVLAGFFAVVLSWQYLWFTPALYPNLPAGLASLAICAWTVLVWRDSPHSPGATSGALVAFLAFSLRWVDAILLWGVFVAVLMTAEWWAPSDRGRAGRVAVPARAVRRTWPVLVGIASSVALWMLESHALFGSTWSRISDAGEPGAAGGPLADQVVKMIWFDTGDNPAESLRHLLTAVHLPALFAVSAAGALLARGRAAVPVRAAWLSGVVLFAAYLIATVHIRIVASGDSLHRFVLPAIVFIAVPVGVAMSSLVGFLRRRMWWRAVPLGAGICVLAAGALGSASLLGPIQNLHGDTGEGARTAAARINEVAAGRECFFYVQYNYPAMQLETACRGGRLAFHRVGPSVDDPILEASASFLYGNMPPMATWLRRGWVLDSSYGTMDLWVREESPGS